MGTRTDLLVLAAVVLTGLLLAGCAAPPDLKVERGVEPSPEFVAEAKPQVELEDGSGPTADPNPESAIARPPLGPGSGRGPTVDPNPGVVVEPTEPVPPRLPTVPTLQAPATVRIDRRGATQVVLQWRDRTDLEDGYIILRGPRSGGLGVFQEVQSFDALDEGFYEFDDRGLEPDTLHCYRVQVTRGAEWKVSDPVCAYTKGADARPVFRAQLEITTANFSDAATSDPIAVRLNSPGSAYVPWGNVTWLDHGHIDFLPGSTYAYDLMPPQDLADITLLSIEKEGTDGLCIASLRLIINRTDGDEGVVLFERSFGDTSSTCHWIDGDDGHEPLLSFFHQDLRASPSWPGADDGWCGGDSAEVCSIQMFPMSFDVLEDRFEGMIGHVLHFEEDARWRPPPVISSGASVTFDPDYKALEITFVDERTIHLKLKLEGSAPLILPDPDVTIQGDLRLTTRRADNGTIVTMSMEGISANVDFNILMDALGLLAGVATGSESCPNLMDCLEAYIEGVIEDGFNPISESYPIATGDVFCGTLRFRPGTGSGGDVSPLLVPCGDLDGDGMPNDWEEDNGLDPDDESDAAEDPDGDGFSNLEEFKNGTDPFGP